MYRVSKILNNNGVIAINTEDNQEYVLLGKGIGFGKKVSQRFEVTEDTATYRLTEQTDRGSAKSLVQEMDPEFLEIMAHELEKTKFFSEIKTSSDPQQFLAQLHQDHISFAVSRIRNQEQISNPLTDDIRVLFHNEFQAASVLRDILQKRMQITIDEHEIGYVALHIHSAIEDEKVSVAMQTARAVRECIEMIEKETGKKIDVISLSYNRLMNHIKYMVARAMTGEDLRINMNEYIESKFPEAYMTAKKVCDMLGKSIGKELDEMEIGYLAMHIERIYSEEIKA